MPHSSSKTLFDALPGALFLTDEKGVVVYASTAMEQRTGYAVGEIIGKRPGNLWGGQMNRAFYQDLWKTIEQDKKPFVGSVINRRKSGQTHREEIHIVPIVGESTYYAEIHPWLTERRTERQFTDEFQLLFNTDTPDAQVFCDWVLPWLGGGSLLVPEKELSAFFQQTCIKPMQQRYGERQDDATLIRAAKNSPEAFQALYAKYWGEIFAYFSRRVANDPIAEELSQDAFLQAFRHIGQFRITNASYRTYLLRIAHNVLANYFRKKKDLPLDDICDLVTVDGGLTHDPIMHERVWVAVGHLNAAEQEVFRLRYREELSVREIATLVQKSENAVKLHLSRGRKKLRTLLDQ